MTLSKRRVREGNDACARFTNTTAPAPAGAFSEAMMSTKRKKSSKAAPEHAAIRTIEDWRVSSIGKAAIDANFELKRVFGLAREERKFKVDTKPGSFVDDCWEAGLVAYNDALKAWLAGDDDRATNRIIYIGAMIGMATRDSAKLAKEVASAVGKNAGDASHVLDRRLKEEALRIWRAEGVSSYQGNKTLAAPKIADRVSRSPSTVRRWLQGQ